jgi:hypothetical protein
VPELPLAGGAVPGSLRVLSGEELITDYRPPSGFVKVFCGACGSPLWSRHPENPQE